MKKAFIIAGLILALAGLMFFFRVDRNVVKINKSFEGFSYMVDGPEASAASRIELQGAYHKRERAYEGRLIINDIVYEKCMIISGISAIYYVNEKRNILGQVFFDEDMQHISLKMPLPVSLTTERKFYQVISAPAGSQAEAADVYRRLQQTTR
ncbi:hypothetical protein P4H66_16950 [Paenibacillus dokdonensis]|uniref:Uncharacterized protein n=1 Tax=Paenibacillus dokdonensis TaxID=2567944 RepID=A0ABU6GTL2_9BACL|nr:hypothetical protein [Paenibacillus dokdonensis]MEC0241507.1 hypothetical protein [Paenibacillus dokdonensis]